MLTGLDPPGAKYSAACYGPNGYGTRSACTSYVLGFGIQNQEQLLEFIISTLGIDSTDYKHLEIGTGADSKIYGVKLPGK